MPPQTLSWTIGRSWWGADIPDTQHKCKGGKNKLDDMLDAMIEERLWTEEQMLGVMPWR